jgi:hypothetical protein
MTDRLRSELDRVGASFGNAGAADHVSVMRRPNGSVRIFGPPREQPRRRWVGPEWRALERLATVPDAGVDALWAAFGQ